MSHIRKDKKMTISVGVLSTWLKALIHGFINPIMLSASCWTALELKETDFPVHIILGLAWLAVSASVYKLEPELPAAKPFNTIALISAFVLLMAIAGWADL